MLLRKVLRTHQRGNRYISSNNTLLPLSYVNGKKLDQITSTQSNLRPLINPATGQHIGEFYDSSKDCVSAAVEGAVKALDVWRALTGFERGKLLKKAADLIRGDHVAITEMEVEDTGKPIWEARMDILGCADSMEFFGGVATTVKGDHMMLSNGNFGYTVREPLGVVAAIGAWNYPFQMACWKSAPALACGNTLVFKPAQDTPRTAVRLAEILTEAGLPNGAFNVIQGAAETGSLLTSHPDVNKVSFTGSVETGSKVMSSCAAGIKHVTLELGGKSPIIIFDDADLDCAVTGAMLGNWLAQGQVCSNGTRVYVQRSLMKSFLEKLITRTKAMKIGNPMEEDTRVGAAISSAHAERVLGYIELARSEGAKVEYGGARFVPADPLLKNGNFLSPCILTECTDTMRVVREEIFGSVMCVMPFDSEEEVLERANDTKFGLAAGVFTSNLFRAHRVISKLQAGSCYINNYNVNPVEIPFGGYKQSGIGRECGELCLQYYTQSKSVYVEMGDISADAPF
ncbi:4-trimethylaminobutyraldehyde dehydrogenase-like [Watersipora subatra]|uniref:4-trimethylaminobutyraldehyde dehydrogenase-like n=1 Tax=Watersipora subatra TaxID=2589382 RepID=UPI00355ADD94